MPRRLSTRPLGVLGPAALLLLAACNGGDHTRSLDGRLACVGCATDPGGAIAVDFGVVAVGRSAERTLRLKNVGPGPMRVEVLPVLAPFGTTTQPTVQLEPRESFDLALYYAPDQEGEASFSLDLGVTSGEALRVHLRGRSATPRIECTPASLDFGTVVIGSSAVRELHCRNLSTEVSAEIVTGIATPYRIEATAELAPGEERAFPISFEPRTAGPARSDTTVGSRGMTPQALALVGEGLVTGLVIEPPPGVDGCYDMGEVLPGQESHLALALTNVGDVAIWVNQIGSVFAPFRAAAPLPEQLPPGGGPLRVDLVFAPGRVTIGPVPESGDADLVYVETGPRRRSICMRGRGAGPVLSCTPDSIDFGVQRAGDPITRRVTCTNVGSLGPSGEQLEVRDVRLGGPFTFTTGGAFPSAGENERFTVDVTYPAASAGEFASALVIATTGGSATIPVHAETRGRSCLALDSTELDFGAVGPSCRSPSRLLTVENLCDFPVSLAELSLDPADGAFHLDAAVQLPFLLQGRGTLELPLRFEPTRAGAQSAVLTLLGEADPEPSTAVLTGSGEDEPTRTDVVDRPLAPRADVLLVLDNSGSMHDEYEERALSANLGRVLDVLLDRSIDFHLGVTTTGTVSEYQTATCPGSVAGLENGRLFPADGSSPRILTSRMDPTVLRRLWKTSIDVGTCRDEERGLSAAARALTPPLSTGGDDLTSDLPGDGNAGFLRDTAMLQVLFVTDDDDKSVLPASEYLTALRSVKGVVRSGELLRVHSIDGGLYTPPEEGMEGGHDEVCPGAAAAGKRYQELVSATGGLRQDICDLDWSDILGAFGSGIVSGPRCFSLTARPGPPPGQELLPPEEWFDVRVNGVPLAATAGTTRFWYFDGSARAICFMGDVAPGSDDRVTITYPVTCR